MKHPEAKREEIASRVRQARPLKHYCMVFMRRRDGTTDTLRTRSYLSGIDACADAEAQIRSRFEFDVRDEYESGTMLLKWKL